ncbi:hypothetical protein BDV95DRAFT_591487 [Massariosphaeria phaeospora]|uniref:Fungal-specific transcription factor domain-containing protein n=1 Tax=Massariosphaeria phaeospora TaxID=100035 RepID=A0A7C8IJZ1_9PLEO|nr:hypothetical protein BDV95DRAFT_591487 [Massariosphaeria phaeospora]
MSFQFVDNSTIDRRVRKVIRSHVMKGRNAGKTVPRASKVAHLSSQLREKQWLQVRFEKEDDTDEDEKILSIYNRVGHEYSAIAIASKLSRDTRKTIHQFFSVVGEAIYPHEYCNPFDRDKSRWLRYMSTDTAYFHVTLCLMSATSDFYLEQSSRSASALVHLSHTLRLINERLSGEGALSDMTLVLVTGLVVYSQLRGDTQTWRTHMQGLHDLIRLRGGLGNFSSDSALLQKICRAEIDFALSEGCSTQFKLHEIPFSHQSWKLICYPSHTSLSPLPSAFLELHPSLREIATDTMVLANVLRTPPKGQKIDPSIFQQALITICYHLIQLGEAIGSANESSLDSCCHLGLTAFMTTLTFQMGRRRLLRREFLAERLRILMQRSVQHLQTSDGLLLWILCLGRIALCGNADDSWLLPLIEVEVRRLGITDWESLLESLNQFPWINGLHGPTAKIVWDSVLERKTENPNVIGTSTHQQSLDGMGYSGLVSY